LKKEECLDRCLVDGVGALMAMTEIVVGSLIMIETITDNKMVSIKYLAATILFDDFSLMVTFLCRLFSIFPCHLTL
jgi:hypothetical protein